MATRLQGNHLLNETRPRSPAHIRDNISLAHALVRLFEIKQHLRRCTLAGVIGFLSTAGRSLRMHWIATHYSVSRLHGCRIFLKDQCHPSGIPHSGDRVLLYERALHVTRRGRRSLVGTVQVTADISLRHPPNGAWKYQIECSELVPARRPVFWEEILRALGLPAATKAATWKGLKRISPEQFQRLQGCMGPRVESAGIGA